MTYTVWYRTKGRFLWKALRGVEGDFLGDNVNPPITGMRVFLFADKRRAEIPLEGTEFVFGKERFAVIASNMEKEAGQKIVTK